MATNPYHAPWITLSVHCNDNVKITLEPMPNPRPECAFSLTIGEGAAAVWLFLSPEALASLRKAVQA